MIHVKTFNNEWKDSASPNDVFLSIGFLSLIERYHKNEISLPVLLKEKIKL